MRRYVIAGILMLCLVFAVHGRPSGLEAATQQAPQRWQYAELTEDYTSGFVELAQHTYFAGGDHYEEIWVFPKTAKVKNTDKLLPDALGRRMARLGADGWELVSTTSGPSLSLTNFTERVYTFKRPLS